MDDPKLLAFPDLTPDDRVADCVGCRRVLLTDASRRREGLAKYEPSNFLPPVAYRRVRVSEVHTGFCCRACCRRAS